MGGKIAEKLVASLLLLFLIVYVGVQLARFFNSPVKTETVYAYTISQFVSARGTVFRDEFVLEGSTAGIQSCLYDDGERVLVGEPVIEFVSSDLGGANRSRLTDAEWEISMLKEAQNTSLNHISNADALSRDIKQQLGYMVQMSATGRYRQMQEVRPALVSMLNKRQIATGKEISFQPRIDTLEKELDALSSANDRSTLSVLKAPVTGYFAKPVDGLESTFTSEVALEADFDELVECIDRASSARELSEPGRIITSQNWYVVIEADKYDVEWISTGQRLDLVIESVAQRVPATVSRVLTKNDDEKAVIVLHCNHIAADTINLREVEVNISLQQYSGLKVDTANLRFQDGERGLYILENNVVRFKKVDPIYEEPGFILSKQPADPYDSATLCQFDQIIIKGTDLADGKIID